jgi:hypothetical protein
MSDLEVVRIPDVQGDNRNKYLPKQVVTSQNTKPGNTHAYKTHLIYTFLMFPTMTVSLCSYIMAENISFLVAPNIYGGQVVHVQEI